jgi:nitrile hydratase subunit alpha
LSVHEDLPAAARVRRLEERLIAAGLVTDEEIDAFLTT